MDYIKARERAEAIVSQMTVEEKLTQVLFNAPAIERLGIKEYNWWNEAAHGVARAGVATVFPQAIAMAATFNPEIVKKVADAISTEARAKYNKSIEFGDRDIFKGLTYWAPNINIFRDPRWGRGQETYGEDPFLTATMGKNFIKGIQGDGEFLKAGACAKHYAAHSGPEKLRHGFDAVVSDKDMYETYLPAFEHAVKAGVAGVMGAYNRTNGQPCCSSTVLIDEILRKKWQFKGYFVSDCGAIKDIYEHHHYADSFAEAAAVALRNGCNLNCGETYLHLVDAYEEDLITEEDITEAVNILYTIRVLLGEFEENRPFSDIGYDKLNCAEHKALNLEAAKETLVLLKNENSFLPLNRNNFRKIAVVGPNAMSTIVLEGNYHGHASEYVTVADGIRKVFDDKDIFVADGANIFEEKINCPDGFGYLLSDGLAAASEADITVLCLGLDRNIEGEETGVYNTFTDGGDKRTMYLPATQMKLAEKVCDVCDNVIVVVMCGSVIDLGEKVRSKAKAIIHGWYPGSLGGLAIAQLLNGDFSPSGKTPLTFYYEENNIHEFSDYSMVGRTYRYMTETPLYPFGYGLSYADFKYSNAEITKNNESTVNVKVKIKNESDISSLEKVQVYAHYNDSRTTTPVFQLCGISAVNFTANEEKDVIIEIDKYWLKAVLDDGSRVEPDGEIMLYIGSHQPDERSNELCDEPCLSIKLK